MTPENPSASEPVKECSTGMNEKESADTTAKLKDELESSMNEIETVYLGDQSIQIPSYKDLPKNDDGKPILSPEQYFKYLDGLVKSPRDVSKLVNEPFMKWEDDTSINDRSFPAYVTMARGGGDCDNISQVAKELLDSLSCRSGHDYKAKVIGAENAHHALTILTEPNGDLAAIDQSDYLYITDIYSASPLFKALKGTDASFHEDEPLGLQGGVKYSVDTATLERDNKNMQVVFAHHYKEPFDPNKELPAAWLTYGKVTVFFDDDTTIFYEKTKMVELNSKAANLFYNENGTLKQKDTPEKIEIYDENGRLTEIDYLDAKNPIKNDFFNPNTGVLTERHFQADQPKKTEFFNGKGIPKQIDYTNGTSEYYDDNGKLKAKTTTEKNEFYDSEGHILQINYLAASNPIDAEIFYPGTTIIHQRDFKPGQAKAHEIYDQTGKLIQINYANGTIDHYNSNGKILPKQ